MASAPDPSALGKAIEESREWARLSQVELARRLGVHQTTISAWEKGKQLPKTIDGLRRIEDALDLTRGTLFVRGGFVELDGSTEQAIMADKRLGPNDVHDLLVLLEVLLARREGRPRRRGGSI